MADRRERNHQWYSRFDEKKMVLVLEGAGEEQHEFKQDPEANAPYCEICGASETDHTGGRDDLEIPAKFEVCETCDGKGSHVNPSIDSHGLSQHDFDEDPEFREAYFEGRYDQPCNECGGRRVVPVMDESRTKKEIVELVNKRIKDHYDHIAEVEAERRYGA